MTLPGINMTLSLPHPVLNNQPPPQSPFTSYRRLWLDRILSHFTPEMTGIVVDLGGKRANKRGCFHPPEEQATLWVYINLEMTTRPDIFADVMAAPLPAQSADVILCTEVLEHLSHPEACVEEIQRLLKPGGLALVSTPFLYPIHADPYDFQRFTFDGLKLLFASFANLELIPMGSFWGTLGMLLDIGLPGIQGDGLQHKALRRTLHWLAWKLYALDLSRSPENNMLWQNFTTGYFIKAIK